MREIGGYQLEHLIGTGGMSRVYSATKVDGGNRVAIKVIPIEDLEPDFERRLRREPEIQQAARHPNIVSLIDWFREGEEFFLVLEFVDGQTLADHVRERPIDFDSARDYAKQILAALSELHTRGIVHRDVKPGNILIGKDGSAKLSDFGIAKFTWQQGETRTQKGLGTPEYMSPEQVRGSDIDARTDIYSLGITLFEALTTRKPFSRGSDSPMGYAETIQKILAEPIPDPRQYVPTLNSAIVEMLRKATAKNPEDRYQSAEEFAGALDAIDPAPDESAPTVVLSDQDRGVAPPPAPVEGRTDVPRRQTEPIERKTSLAPLWAVLALLAVAVAGYFLVMAPEGDEPQIETGPTLSTEEALAVAQRAARQFRRYMVEENVPALAAMYAESGVDYLDFGSATRRTIRAEFERLFGGVESVENYSVQIERVEVLNDSTVSTDWLIDHAYALSEERILQGRSAIRLQLQRIGADWMITRQKQRWVNQETIVREPLDTAAVDTADTMTPTEEPVPTAPPTEAEIRSIASEVVRLVQAGETVAAWDRYAAENVRTGPPPFPPQMVGQGVEIGGISVSGMTARVAVATTTDGVRREYTVGLVFNDQGKISNVTIQ